MQKFDNTIGWLGMLFVQCASFPTLWMLLNGQEVSLPDLSMVLCIMVGLLLYFWRAIIQNDVVYMVSNGLGFFIQSVMMATIIFK